ncbi:MAG: GspE/PulE family protein [Candidatus Sericytochromatia bacterium]
MTRSNPPKSTSLKLGDLMVRDGLLTTDGLNKALAIQKQGSQSGQYKPLGQVCLDLRLITRQDLQRFLSRYHKHIQIGELLVNMGLISQEQLERVLQIQFQSAERLGVLLVRSGIITESQLTDALSLQLGIPRIVPLLDLISSELLADLDEEFVTKRICLPVHRQGNQIVVVMSDPLNSDLLQELIDRYQCKVVPAIAPANEILATIHEIFDPRYQPVAQQDPSLDEDILFEEESESRSAHQTSQAEPDNKFSEQIKNLVQVLLRSTVQASATALHLESHEHYLRVRLRSQGVLKHLTDLPLEMNPALADCLKHRFDALPPDEPVRTLINHSEVELRLSTLPSRWGENLVVHVHEAPSHLLGIENLGFSPLNLQLYTQILDQAGGILLAVGPARSGKATLLTAALDYLHNPSLSMLTLGSSVGYSIPGLIESVLEATDSVNPRYQAMLAQDADIIMLEELADRPGADFLGQAALQGRKVFAALNACDTATGLYRLMQLQARVMLDSPLPMALIAQRLVRRLCENCKQPHTPTDDELRHLNLLPSKGEPFPFYSAGRCNECGDQGYRGITALHEILVLDESLRDELFKGHSAASMRRHARSKGHLVSMSEDGIYKALQGITTLDEIRRVVVSYPDGRPAQTQRDIYALCQGGE